jgi:hypothetical protein
MYTFLFGHLVDFVAANRYAFHRVPRVPKVPSEERLKDGVQTSLWIRFHPLNFSPLAFPVSDSAWLWPIRLGCGRRYNPAERDKMAVLAAIGSDMAEKVSASYL